MIKRRKKAQMPDVERQEASPEETPAEKTVPGETGAEALNPEQTEGGRGLWERGRALLGKEIRFGTSKGLLRRRLSDRQLFVICRQLSFALSGGMALPAALLLLGTELEQAVCRAFLLDAEAQVRQGSSLAQALGKSEIGFPPVLLEFVLAGEQSGALPKTLEQAAIYFQKQQQNKQLLGAALFYPALLVVLMGAALAAMCIFVAPAIVQTYDNFEAELPQLTRTLLALAGWVQLHWRQMLFCGACLIALAAAALTYLLRQPRWRERMHALLLRLPLAGRLYQQYWFIQISQALGLMLTGGMLLPRALEALQQIYRRGLFVGELERLSARVAEGHSFGADIAQCSFVPRMAGQMLRVSEATGTLSEGLLQLCGYYQHQFQQRLQTLTGLLEPCLVVFIGLMVLALASGLFLPLVRSYQYLL